MPRLRRVGIVLAAGLSLLAQQPVVPHDAVPGEMPAPAVAGQSDAAPVEASATEIARLYDGGAHTWHAWRIVRDRQDGGTGSVQVANSADGRNFSQWQACLPEDSYEWDSSIESAAVIENVNAPDGKRYLLWYVGSRKNAPEHWGLRESRLGLATSADGQTFGRLPAHQTSHAAPGMILSAQDAFPGNKSIVSASFGTPQLVKVDEGYQMTFFRVGFDANGAIAAAGLAGATSEDGSRWSFANAPFSLQVVGPTKSPERLVNQLKQLAAAYSATQPSL